jgi:hypothetical protein
MKRKLIKYALCLLTLITCLMAEKFSTPASAQAQATRAAALQQKSETDVLKVAEQAGVDMKKLNKWMSVAKEKGITQPEYINIVNVVLGKIVAEKEAFKGRKEGVSEQKDSILDGFFSYHINDILAKRPNVKHPIFVPPFPPSVSAGPCNNGGFELGNLNNWTCYAASMGFIFSATGTSGGTVIPTTGIPQIKITQVSDGNDPVLMAHNPPIRLPVVNEGKYAVRLGDLLGNMQAAKLEYSFIVDASNSQFTFSYALVLEQHPNSDPFFQVEVLDSNGNIATIPTNPLMPSNPLIKKVGYGAPDFGAAGDVFSSGVTGDYSYTGVPGGDAVKGYYQSVVYRPWECVKIDLSRYVRQKITLRFTSADCAGGPHAGWAYIDGLCSSSVQPTFTMPDKICNTDSRIIADGSATTAETDFKWTIEATDALGNPVSPTQSVSTPYTNGQAGAVDLKALYNSKYKMMPCDKYYKATLAVKNGCGENSFSKVFLVKCCDLKHENIISAPCSIAPVATLDLKGNREKL